MMNMVPLSTHNLTRPMASVRGSLPVLEHGQRGTAARRLVLGAVEALLRGS